MNQDLHSPPTTNDPPAGVPRPEGSKPHISVCVCTYRRPHPLERLLKELNRQQTGGLFTYSVVIVDNDPAQSGAATVERMRAACAVPIRYCVQPERGIAHARNKVVAHAEGEFLAFIDDDEFPISTWLVTLFAACGRYNVDGVLGPVRRHFDEPPPAWLGKSHLLDRRVNPTGMPVEWREARTGNVLLKRRVIEGDSEPFRPEFKSGEDRDFFRRKIEAGFCFIWSAEAEVFEVLPSTRWKRSYFMKRGLLNGAMETKLPEFGISDVLKALVAIPTYTVALPFVLLFGQYRFMNLLFSLCCHTGRLLAAVGIHIVRGQYVTD
jgi:glycosyltransferase involved in cell wall biosynthesis